MRNLLSANFLRLRKSALFWGLLAVSFVLGALIAFNYYEMSREESIPLDGAFFSYPILACILTAVFIPLFLGREYSDGAIRSKVAAGRSRPLIYAANLLAGMAASALFCGAYMLAALTVGTPLVGFIVMDAGQAMFIILGSLAAVAALCALFTLFAMNCGRKAVSAAACVLGVFLLLFASIYLRSRLLSPEYLSGFWNAAGEYVPGPPTPNPQYLDGAQRAVFEMLYALLPSSQAVEYSSQQTQNLRWMPLWSLAVIALSTAAGIALFRKKDLK